MANRAYLFATDNITDEQAGEKHVIGLSEFSYDIPLSYKILVCSNTEIKQSLIWDHPIALAGSFDNGCQLLFDLLDMLLKSKHLENFNEFSETYEETKDFFEVGSWTT